MSLTVRRHKLVLGPQPPATCRLQTGVSIIELLVGMSIGLVITIAIATIYLNSRLTYTSQEANARVQETGRYALEIIGRSIRQAGNVHVLLSSNKRYCNCVPITGTDGASGAADTLTVRFEAGEDELNSGAWRSRDCAGTLVNAGSLITNAFQLVGNDFECNGQPLAADIEDFQIQYGVDTVGNDQSVDKYVTNPANFVATPRGAVTRPKPVNRIVAVRACVLVRSATTGAVPTGGRFVNCSGVLTNNPDTSLRRAFTATYSLRNTVTNLP